jgi:uncharacterized protein involved in exopolysaccharide biosynthesis
VFQSEAVLLYKDRVGTSPVGMQHDAPSTRRLSLSLQETLFSHNLLGKLITEFGLYDKIVARYGVVAGIEQMQKKDLHFSAREGYTFRVAFDSRSPELAQAVTERACQLLLQARSEVQTKESKEIQEFLDVEKRNAEKKVRDHEAALTLLVAQHPEVIDFGQGRNNALLPDSAPADTSAFGFEMQSIQLRERLEQMRRRSAAGSTDVTQSTSTSGDVSEARQRAQAELAAAQRELSEKQSQFTEQYPDVKRAAMRVATAKAYLRRLEDNASRPTPATPPAANSQPGAGSGATDNEPVEMTFLKQQLELLEKQARAARSSGRSQPRAPAPADPKALAGIRTQYIELERRARESRDHLALLENRHFQVEMQALFASQDEQGDLVVADPAFKPVAPLRSPRRKILIAGLLGSMVLSLAVGLGRAWRDDRLHSVEDLQRFDLPPLLCEIPNPEPKSRT